MTSAMRDLHQSWRVLCRSPGFTAVTILTLAFGIGVNVAMFSVMNGILLRPLPYQDPERIVRLWESNPTTGHTRFEVLPGSYLDWRERSKTLEAVALYYQDDRLVTGGGQPQRLNVAVVSPSLFEILGVAPILGRGTPPPEARQDKDVEWPEIVLSHRAWRQRFGGDPSVLGMTLRFEGFASVAVVGVMPPGFEFPKG
ncbi:MAG: ABC transporter permease, partial [Vicinamibacteraceae bacterium]